MVNSRLSDLPAGTLVEHEAAYYPEILHRGVHVIEEIFVQQTRQIRTRTIYRGRKVEANSAAELRKSKQAH
ncbi:MAG: hypothetical protein VW709_22125 [Rickettsiales bacterium]